MNIIVIAFCVILCESVLEHPPWKIHNTLSAFQECWNGKIDTVSVKGCAPTFLSKKAQRGGGQQWKLFRGFGK